MERVFSSALTNDPQKFNIRIGISIRGVCRWNLHIDIRIRTLSAINIRICIRTMQRRMRGLLSISSNSSLYDRKRKRLTAEKVEKLLFLKKKNLSLTLNID